MTNPPFSLDHAMREGLGTLLHAAGQSEGWYGRPYFSASDLEHLVREKAERELPAKIGHRILPSG